MASHHPIRKSVKAASATVPVIPDKLYFRIGDVARLLDVPAYVLRFWETEFPQLKPNKGGTGQRLYRRKDVETALRIKGLLYDQGYTIPGARQALRSESESSAPPSETVILSERSESKDPEGAQLTHTVKPISTTNPALHALRDELRSLCAQLSRPVGNAAPASAKVKSIRPHAPAESSVSLNQQDLFPSE
jgi:DNA-binding transcriptional MerR regulator